MSIRPNPRPSFHNQPLWWFSVPVPVPFPEDGLSPIVPVSVRNHVGRNVVFHVGGNVWIGVIGMHDNGIDELVFVDCGLRRLDFATSGSIGSTTFSRSTWVSSMGSDHSGWVMTGATSRLKWLAIVVIPPMEATNNNPIKKGGQGSF